MKSFAAFSDLEVKDVARIYNLSVKQLSPLFLIIIAALGINLCLTNSVYLPIFLATSVPALAIIFNTRVRNEVTLPIFPLYIIIQFLAYAAPLTAESINTGGHVDVTPALLAKCSIPLLIWFSALWLGWSLTPRQFLSQPRAQSFTDSLQRLSFLPHLLIGISIALHWLISTPFFWSFGGFSAGLRNPFYTVSTLALSVGSFIGAYGLAQGKLRRPFIWMSIILIPLFQSLSSLLLSSALTLLISIFFGLWLGRWRHLIVFTMAALLLLGFLHSGKTAMRERYWFGNAQAPGSPIELAHEWIDASIAASIDDSSNSLFNERFNSLQNLLFVEAKLSSGVRQLDGKTLFAIPQAILPRFLSPLKGRSHESQIILNLHFGRQASEYDTFTTYISWGFLSEGIANFGSRLGPLAMGFGVGSLIRLSENVGRGQSILSVPGLMSLVLFVNWLIEYEIASSTFAAAIFQRLVVIFLLGLLLDLRKKPLFP